MWTVLTRDLDGITAQAEPTNLPRLLHNAPKDNEKISEYCAHLPQRYRSMIPCSRSQIRSLLTTSSSLYTTPKMPLPIHRSTYRMSKGQLKLYVIHDRIMGIRRWWIGGDSPGDDSCLSLRALARESVFPSSHLGEPPRPVVCSESVLPSSIYQSINSLSSYLSIPIFQQFNDLKSTSS